MSDLSPMQILFVCTGNTCRSPMAAAMLRRALTEHGLSHVQVASAGIGAWDGAPASEGSLLVGMENGLDLSEHRARLLSRELARSADLILTMSEQQRDRVQELGGGARVHLLGEYAGRAGAAREVTDPYGLDLDAYRTTFRQLEDMLAAVAARITAGRSGEPR